MRSEAGVKAGRGGTNKNRRRRKARQVLLRWTSKERSEVRAIFSYLILVFGLCLFLFAGVFFCLPGIAGLQLLYNYQWLLPRGLAESLEWNGEEAGRQHGE